MDTLRKLKEGKHVEIPVYDFGTHARAKYKVRLPVALWAGPATEPALVPSTQCTEPMWWCLRESLPSATPPFWS